MQSKLDYFRFSFPISLLGSEDQEYTLSHILMAFHDHTKHKFLGVVTNGLWQWAQAAGFYTSKIQCPKTQVVIEWKAGNPHALCTLSGQSCDAVLRLLSPADLALAANGRATRLDFAVDIVTEVTPAEFVSERGDSRIFSTTSIKSETGLTEYIGSRSSERMARVYRYFEPHPRSNLLRAEVEYKGDAAKQACAALLTMELTEVSLSAHLPFSWKHSIWQPGAIEVSKIPARFYDREGANTLKWLNDSVVPALKTAHGNGLIDLKAWMEANFKDFL